MPKRKTELASVSDLFATSERSSSVRYETSSDYQSDTSGYITRAKLKQRPIVPTKPGIESVLKNVPDFSSFERYNLLVESDHSKENDPQKPNSSELEHKFSELSVEGKKQYSDKSSLAHPPTLATDKPSMFCSTPGPEYANNEMQTVRGASRHKELRRLGSLENLNATPIPCPELIVEASQLSNSLVHCANSSWIQLKVRANPNGIYSATPSPTGAVLTDATNRKASADVAVDDRGPCKTQTGTKSGAFVKRLTRRFRIDNMILNQSYWALYEAGDPKGTLMKICGQTDFAKFSTVFTPYRKRHLQKIGEGCFGEVFRCPAQLTASTTESAEPEATDELVAVKLVPIEGSVPFNGDSQKTFGEVLSEVIVAKELTALSYGFRNQTEGFVQLKKVHLVCGAMPAYLVKAWEIYKRNKHSENDHPRIFPKTQLWLVIEMLFSGSALEDNVPPCPAARLSVLRQVALSLAVAESELQFEHRDLHWGNVLVRSSRPDPAQRSMAENDCFYCSTRSSAQTVTFRLDYQAFAVPSHGVHASIIDFTLSRLEQDGGLVYVDLAADPTLFESQGDYQFDVYRLMRAHNGNKWKEFTPKTNIMWLHYLATKLRLLPSDTDEDPCHASVTSQLTQLEADLGTLSYQSASDLVSRHSVFTAVRT